MESYLAKFKRRAQEIKGEKPILKKLVPRPLYATRFTVYKEFGGDKTPIAWGLTESEALVFISHAKRLLRAMDTIDGMKFEATTYTVRAE